MTGAHDTHRTLLVAAIRAALPWTLWLLGFNIVWEVAQLPLYALGRYAQWPALGYAVLHCTLGDVAVAFVLYLIAALLTTEPQWPLRRPLAGLAIVLLGGESFTIWAEWYNVYVLHNWAYAAGMPMIHGIGAAPLLQWLVLPMSAVAILRYRYRRRMASEALGEARFTS